LGHSDPGFTLRAYVHLFDEDLPTTDFLAGVGNEWATRAAENSRENVTPRVAENSGNAAESSDTARLAETADAYS
jgi:hypothetical protein